MELIPAQPKEIESIFLGSDCLRAADEGQSFKAACRSIVCRHRRNLVYAHGQHAAAGRAQAVDLRRYTEQPVQMGREAAEMADRDPVPVELIEIVDGRERAGPRPAMLRGQG